MGSDAFISWPALYRDRLLDANIEDGLIEGTLNVRTDWPDAADHPGAEIFLDPLNRRWRGSLEKRGLELDTVSAVVDPASARLDQLAGRDRGRVPENRDEFALPTGFDTQDAEPVLVVVEGDALDQTGQNPRLAGSPSVPAASGHDGD